MTVSIAGSDCDNINLISDGEIQCVTTNHSGSVETNVIVTVGQLRAVEVRLIYYKNELYFCGFYR